MNERQEKYQQRIEELREAAFTDDLKKNSLSFDEEFNKLHAIVDRLNIVNKYRIQGFVINMTEHNAKILSAFIKDFDAYNKLIDMENSSDKIENQTDLISIIYYAEKVHNELVCFDLKSNSFFIGGNKQW